MFFTGVLAPSLYSQGIARAMSQESLLHCWKLKISRNLTRHGIIHPGTHVTMVYILENRSRQGSDWSIQVSRDPKQGRV